jgi:hypothetical protein
MFSSSYEGRNVERKQTVIYFVKDHGRLFRKFTELSEENRTVPCYV